MADCMTRWGYEVALPDGEVKLPPIISYEDFIILTGGRLVSSADRIDAMLDAVSQAVRDWCGWHVSPILECSWVGTGNGRLLLLPCMSVSSVESIEVQGVEQDFEWERSGKVRISGRFPDAWRSVEASFTAGIDAADGIGAAVLQIATNALVATPGVREEHAGGVGATYNQTANGVSGGVRLLESDYRLLAPYRMTVR